MPSVKSILNKVFRSIDLFSNVQFLRYNGETEYTTNSGGVVSLAVITILIILFASMGVKTVNKQIITSTKSTKYESHPSKTTINVGP